MGARAYRNSLSKNYQDDFVRGLPLREMEEKICNAEYFAQTLSYNCEKNDESQKYILQVSYITLKLKPLKKVMCTQIICITYIYHFL